LLAISLTLSCSVLEEVLNKEINELKESLQGSLMNSNLHFAASEGIPNGNYSIITGVQLIAANSNSEYGTLIFTSSEELVELYLQIDGENGYYWKTLSSSDIVNYSNGSYAYSVDLDFAPGLNANSKTIQVSGKSKSGKTSSPEEAKNEKIKEYSCNNNNWIEGDFAGFIGSFDMGRNSGSFRFEYETYSMPDEINIYGDSKARGTPIFHYPSGGTDGWRSETVYFSEPIITVKVIGSREGTAWSFVVHCP